MHAFRGTCVANCLLLLCLATTAAPGSDPSTAPAPATAPNAPLSVDLGNGIRLDLLLIRPGKYVQGSPPTEAGRADDEAAREVTLTQPFYVGRTAVTRAQFGQFVAETGYRTEAEIGTSGGYGWDGQGLSQRKAFHWRNPGFPQDGDHPVCLVTYPDAEAFCRWLSKKAGRAVALPTEAQWEYACRAGTTSPWHNGAADPAASSEVAWSKQTAGNATHAATSSKPNAWGLTIGGNVSEWCQDWYGPYPADPAIDPVAMTPPAGEKPRRVLRGGSWNRDAKATRSAARFRADPRSRNADIGFRVVAVAGGNAAMEGSTGTGGPRSTATDPAAGSAAPAVAALGPPPTSPDRPSGAPGSAGEPAQAHGMPVEQEQPSGGFPWGGLACGVAGLAGVAYVASRFLRAMGLTTANTATGSAGRSQPAGAGAGNVRVVADGFWLRLPGVASGSRVHYTCRVAGGPPTSASAEYVPGQSGHFVYTGGTPESVRVLSVEPGPSAAAGDVSLGGPGFSDTSGPAGFATGLGIGATSGRRPATSRPFRSTTTSSRSSSGRSSSSHRPSAY